MSNKQDLGPPGITLHVCMLTHTYTLRQKIVASAIPTILIHSHWHLLANNRKSEIKYSLTHTQSLMYRQTKGGLSGCKEDINLVPLWGRIKPASSECVFLCARMCVYCNLSARITTRGWGYIATIWWWLTMARRKGRKTEEEKRRGGGDSQRGEGRRGKRGRKQRKQGREENN